MKRHEKNFPLLDDFAIPEGGVCGAFVREAQELEEEQELLNDAVDMPESANEDDILLPEEPEDFLDDGELTAMKIAIEIENIAETPTQVLLDALDRIDVRRDPAAEPTVQMESERNKIMTELNERGIEYKKQGRRKRAAFDKNDMGEEISYITLLLRSEGNQSVPLETIPSYLRTQAVNFGNLGHNDFVNSIHQIADKLEQDDDIEEAYWTWMEASDLVAEDMRNASKRGSMRRKRAEEFPKYQVGDHVEVNGETNLTGQGWTGVIKSVEGDWYRIKPDESSTEFPEEDEGDGRTFPEFHSTKILSKSGQTETDLIQPAAEIDHEGLEQEELREESDWNQEVPPQFGTTARRKHAINNIVEEILVTNGYMDRGDPKITMLASEIINAIGEQIGDYMEMDRQELEENVSIVLPEVRKAIGKKAKFKKQMSYGAEYVRVDIENGMTDKQIIRKLRDYYDDIGKEQAQQIVDAVRNGGTPDYSHHTGSRKKASREQGEEINFKPLGLPQYESSEGEIIEEIEPGLYRVSTERGTVLVEESQIKTSSKVYEVGEEIEWTDDSGRSRMGEILSAVPGGFSYQVTVYEEGVENTTGLVTTVYQTQIKEGKYAQLVEIENIRDALLQAGYSPRQLHEECLRKGYKQVAKELAEALGIDGDEIDQQAALVLAIKEIALSENGQYPDEDEAPGLEDRIRNREFQNLQEDPQDAVMQAEAPVIQEGAPMPDEKQLEQGEKSLMSPLSEKPEEQPAMPEQQQMPEEPAPAPEEVPVEMPEQMPEEPKAKPEKEPKKPKKENGEEPDVTEKIEPDVMEPEAELNDEQIQSIQEFVQAHPDLEDDEFHEFAESLGVDPDKAEEIVYQMVNKASAKMPSSGATVYFDTEFGVESGILIGRTASGTCEIIDVEGDYVYREASNFVARPPVGIKKSNRRNMWWPEVR